MTSENSPLTLDPGELPLNAELIEAALRDIWRQLANQTDLRPGRVKICLANMIIVADAVSLAEAERLAAELSAIQPSRTLLVTIDDTVPAQSAAVRTACRKSHAADSLVCFETISLASPTAGADALPGALRSLVLGAVPVITVDFRAFQQSPEFDALLLSLSDFYFVRADVVPAGKLQRHFIPLTWYHTLPIRELIARYFDHRLAVRAEPPLVDIRLAAGEHADGAESLIAGWLLSRLAPRGPFTAVSRRVTVPYGPSGVTLHLADPANHSPHLVTMQFADGARAVVIESRHDGERTHHLAAPGFHATRARVDFPLGQYIIAATRTGHEFSEYQRVVDTLRTADVA